jgi:hypothetical protein
MITPPRGVIENMPLVVDTRPLADATRVYPSPALSIERSPKLAEPAEAFTAMVPLRTAPAGLVPMLIVINELAVVTVLPRLSWTTTVGGPGSGSPAVVLVGCVENASFVAAAAVTLKVALVTGTNPVAEAVNV